MGVTSLGRHTCPACTQGFTRSLKLCQECGFNYFVCVFFIPMGSRGLKQWVVTSISHMGEMRDSDWSRPNLLRSDWLPIIGAIMTTNLNPPEHNFLFVTPETLSTPTVFELLRKISSNDLNFFVIDEAHCIDMWGFHFRPSYSELWKLAEFGRPILAMTGTATKRAEDAILKSLGLPADTVVIKQCSNRPNLLYHVLEKKSDGKDALVELIKKEFTVQCGIVYCVERSDTVHIAYRLKVAGINAVYFHAGMDVFAKQQSVENWKSGGAHVMCATVAFGMGIDKPNVRFVIHHSVPKDLESYVQESDRTGRDGIDAHCYIYFRFEDRTKHLRNISSLPDTDRKSIFLNRLNDIVKYCITPVCRRKQIVTYFDGVDNSGSLCNRSCDVCSANTNMTPVDHSVDAVSIVKCVESM